MARLVKKATKLGKLELDGLRFGLNQAIGIWRVWEPTSSGAIYDKQSVLAADAWLRAQSTPRVKAALRKALR